MTQRKVPAIAKADYATIASMLQTRRPAWSKTENKFIKTWLVPLGCIVDGFGNYILKIGNAPIVWSCHTDTVHRKNGRVGLLYDRDDMTFHSAGKYVLGADDAAGVWLMREMILAGVGGLYIFHRAEEIGGQGSAFIADETPELLEGYQHAIAFDRKGYSDIITHQSGSRCCSEAFAASLASVLGGIYQPDPTGSFTDTANYTHLIPECTNVSIGYHNEHSTKESLNAGFLTGLRDVVVRADFSSLPVARDVNDTDSFWDYNDDLDIDLSTPYASVDTLYNAIVDYPDETADLLDELGMTHHDIMERLSIKRHN